MIKRKMDFTLEDAQTTTLGVRIHLVSACLSALRGSFDAVLACLRRPHCATITLPHLLGAGSQLEPPSHIEMQA